MGNTERGGKDGLFVFILENVANSVLFLAAIILPSPTSTP